MYSFIWVGVTNSVKKVFPILTSFTYIQMNCKNTLPDGELNPGLPRDRRGYLPLYYREFDGGIYVSL